MLTATSVHQRRDIGTASFPVLSPDRALIAVRQTYAPYMYVVYVRGTGCLVRRIVVK
jgi:hypothetical protein